jgi:hypothetical protein
MSLNIFIDVDGTLLNSNEQIDPRAKEILRQTVLKLSAEYPDSGLYLWSGAGGAYARKAAEDCGVVSFFSGFAGKPDVIVDDNPSSVFPRRAILWRGDGQWGAFQKNLFVEHSPSNRLKQTTRDIWEWVNQGHSFHFNTAHIDLSPRATRSMRSFKLQPGKFLNMVNADARKWFLVLLRLAKRLRVVRFDEAGIISAARENSLAQHIQQSLPEIWREIEARELEVSLI